MELRLIRVSACAGNTGPLTPEQQVPGKRRFYPMWICRSSEHKHPWGSRSAGAIAGAVIGLWVLLFGISAPAAAAAPAQTPVYDIVAACGDLENVGIPDDKYVLDVYEIKYVKSEKGHSIYTFCDSEGYYKRPFYISEGAEVLVLAEDDGMSFCCFEASNGAEKCAWVGSNLLVSRYTSSTAGKATPLSGDDALEQALAQWTDVVELEVLPGTLVALRADGTVCAAFAEANAMSAAESWTDIVRISLSSTHLLGLDKDGRVHVATRDGSDPYGLGDVADWPAMTEVLAGDCATYGIGPRGQLYFTGDPLYYPYADFLDKYSHLFPEAAGKPCRDLNDLGDYMGVLDNMNNLRFFRNFGKEYRSKEALIQYLNRWNHLTSLDYGYSGIIGISDSTGYSLFSPYGYEKADLRGEHPVFAGFGPQGCALLVTENRLVIPLKQYGNTAPDSRWQDPTVMSRVLAIYGGENHVVALKDDLSLAAAGDNSAGQCSISHWENVRKLAVCGNATFGITGDGKILAAGQLTWGSETVSLR